ncbi:Uncharacterized protein HSBGL_0514 [Halapricum desulfuricans]|uniref:Uncharacterized protein n=1 Tax=Halapricum desulfuricans TaxID=2841257 RepID=A0A897NJ85_9EURY|nr:Uncharacterized protein HSBGL_0514 [Halapricum desulfuricans]
MCFAPERSKPTTLIPVDANGVTKIVSNMDEPEPHPDDHLDELEDGAGCTEIWEKLSEQRESAAD